MSENQIPEADLHAFIDGELDAVRADIVAGRIAADAALAARVEHYRTDQARLAALFGPLIDRPVPTALVRTVEGRPAARPAPRQRRWLWGVPALAAGLVCAWLATSLWLGGEEAPVAAALAARSGALAAAKQYDAETAGDEAARDRLLQEALAQPVKLPDLGKAGFTLAGVDLYADAGHRASVQLRYHDKAGRLFTVYLSRPSGPDRFELLERGAKRICVWENEELGAVMVGEMPSQEMLRVASLTYADLNF
jgi:anti-sigma factor RsiW